MISVIIPTIGRNGELLGTLDDLSAQVDTEFELIIVTQNHDNDEIIASLSKKNIESKLIFLSEPNASLARNIGIKYAKHKYCLFLDDDVKISNKAFLQAHVEGLSSSGASGVVGGIGGLPSLVGDCPAANELTVKRWPYFERDNPDYALLRAGWSGNLCVEKDLAVQCGGMDAHFEKGAFREEADFCLRYTEKNGPLLYSPAASLKHFAAESGGSRNWGEDKNLSDFHHRIGEWYFWEKLKARRNVSSIERVQIFWTLARRQVLVRHKLFRWFFKRLGLSARARSEAKRRFKSGAREISNSPDVTISVLYAS